MCCELTSDFIFHLIFSCENHGSQPRNPHPTGHDYDQVEQRCHINIIIFNELATLIFTVHPLEYRINLPIPFPPPSLEQCQPPIVAMMVDASEMKLIIMIMSVDRECIAGIINLINPSKGQRHRSHYLLLKDLRGTKAERLRIVEAK